MAGENPKEFSYKGLRNSDTKDFFKDKKNLEIILEVIEESLKKNYKNINEKNLKAFKKALKSSKNLKDFIFFIDELEDVKNSLKKGFKHIIVLKIKEFNNETPDIIEKNAKKTLSTISCNIGNI